MPSLSTVGMLAGVSSALGLLAILAYWFFLLQRRGSERSARQLIEGEGIFNAQQIVPILAQFDHDASRLEALKALTQHDVAKATSLLRKLESRIDLGRLHEGLARTWHKQLLTAGIVFLAFGLLGFVARYLLAQLGAAL